MQFVNQVGRILGKIVNTRYAFTIRHVWLALPQIMVKTALLIHNSQGSEVRNEIAVMATIKIDLWPLFVFAFLELFQQN